LAEFATRINGASLPRLSAFSKNWGKHLEPVDLRNEQLTSFFVANIEVTTPPRPRIKRLQASRYADRIRGTKSCVAAPMRGISRVVIPREWRPIDLSVPFCCLGPPRHLWLRQSTTIKATQATKWVAD